MSPSPKNPIVIDVPTWNVSSIRYMQPKISDRGSKSINIISTQTNRSLHISTPLMMTWGIGDFTDEKTGESDGKYTASLVFPSVEYATPQTSEFLTKMKACENQILDDAVKNSELWFGEEMSREVAKHTFFSFLKYTKDKVTKKVDLSKPPTLRIKVPNYNNKWNLEIYDTKHNRIFPTDNELITPLDLIPKRSQIACVIQCSGLWFGGKGWGLNWKLIQCVVKPQEIQSVFGQCHVKLSDNDIETLEKQVEPEDEDEPVSNSIETTTVKTTYIEDSDDETPVVEKVVVTKKVVKKALTPLVVEEKEPETELEPVVVAVVEEKKEAEPEPEPVAVAVVEEAPKKKKVVKKAT